jgi:hypothetical protein
MQWSYTREQLDGEAVVIANCSSSSLVRRWSSGRKEGRQWLAQLITARWTRVKQPDEVSNCFMMPSRAGACPREGEWRLTNEANRQAGY